MVILFENNSQILRNLSLTLRRCQIFKKKRSDHWISSEIEIFHERVKEYFLTNKDGISDEEKTKLIETLNNDILDVNELIQNVETEEGGGLF